MKTPGMFTEIFRFELKQTVRSGLFWMTGGLLFLMAFGAVTSDVVQIGGSVGAVNRNAPFVIQQFMLVLSLVGVFATTAFVALAVIRDYDYRTHEIFFSTSVRKRDYFWGRFLGAFVAALLVMVPVALGIMVGSAMPWLDPERVGPFMLSAYVESFLIIVVPNLLLMSAVFFGLATMTRSIMWTYVGLVGFLVFYGISGTLLGNLENEAFAAILDPFGGGPFGLVSRYWTVAERNTQVVPLAGEMLTNRLLWSGVALLALLASYARFSFTARNRSDAGSDAPEEEALAIASAGAGGFEPASVRPYTRSAMWAAFKAQTRREIVEVLRSAAFPVILAMGVLNLIGNASVLGQLFGTPVYPRTYLFFQVIQGGFLLFALIILTFYSGEMVFRERQQRMDEVYDAFPVPNSVYWGSKLVALSLIVLALLVVAILASMGVQLYHGYTNLQPGLYARGVLLLIGVPFLLVAVLALAAQVLTNNKYVGFLAMVVYFVSGPVLAALDFDHNLWLYGNAPFPVYSEMNGFGHFTEPVFWFFLFWSLVALLLVTALHLFWVRGKETALGTRLALARQRFTPGLRAFVALDGVAILAVGAWILYNTNVLNDYQNGDTLQARAARYEKEYKQYEAIPQPQITAIRTEVDLYPERREADIRGTYRLVNDTEGPIRDVHITVPGVITEHTLDVPGAELTNPDDEFDHFIYRLASPMQPEDTIEVDFDLAVRTPGFKNNGFVNRLAENGTFLHSGGFFPHIGYNRGAELQDPNERRKRGLPPVERLPKLEDVDARRFHMLGREADWVDYEAIVSTSADQIALAPGYLEREWEEDGRRYFHYVMDAPILAYHSYLSARWEVTRDRWNDVDIVIYHHPEHDYNVQKMIEATKASLDYFTENFGPYQHRQFRILEFPRYATFAEAFPNTIPFSEAIGFIARLDDPDEIDYVTYVTAHELAHQWWAHQVIGAGVQGATVLVETMAQYSALMVMEDMYGPELMRRFLRYELDGYLRGRGGELIEELPLMRVEFQQYIHYRKGSLALYALKDYVGEDALNEQLARFVADMKFSDSPYPTTLEFLSYLREAVPPEHERIIEDLFETITLFENRARNASYTQRPDGSYVVSIDYEARKYRADGSGAETEIGVDDWIDVGVFGERGDGDPPEGKILYLEKRRVTDAEGVIEVVVDEEPRQAGIDPFHKLVDRNPENNLVSVDEADE